MPRLTVAVVARSELFGCGAMAALDAFGVATRLVLVRGPGLRAEDFALDADVAVLEWNEPNRNAWDQLRALHAANPTTKLLVSSLHTDEAAISRLLARGASGVVGRSASAADLRAGVDDVVAGRIVRPAVLRPSPTDARPTVPSDGLTARQAQIVDLICSGMPNAQIAERLHLSVNSIKSHIRGAYRAMDVQTRPQAVLWGLARGYGGHVSDDHWPPAAAPTSSSGSSTHPTDDDESQAPDLADWLAEQADAGLEGADEAAIRDVIGAMIEHPRFPCLGARSALKRDGALVRVLDDMTDDACLSTLSAELADFAAIERGPREFGSFIAVFRRPRAGDEREFENLLWGMLQRLHDRDDAPWAERVSPDTTSPHFSFSLGGVPFFLVGLHPQASRIARRAPLTTVVFNLHDQFEQLRADGGFDRMRDAIRRRDAALQGSINPVVTDHGRSSEARQYSGRHVEDDWRAPFTAHPSKENPDD